LPAASTTAPVTRSAATARELVLTRTNELRNIITMTRSEAVFIRFSRRAAKPNEPDFTKMREGVVWSHARGPKE